MSVGHIPPEIGGLAGVSYLDLGVNSLRGDGIKFSGYVFIS